MRPISTTSAKFHFDVVKADRPVLVDFYADWCPTCRHLSPVLDDLAGDWGDRLKVVKVDVEKHPTLADRFDVRRLPTLVLFRGDDAPVRLGDSVRRGAIESQLDALLGPAPAPVGSSPPGG